MHSLPLANLRHLLCLGAHPDDIEIGCGGTLMTLMQANPQMRVDWVLFSSNQTRQAEAEASFRAWCPDHERCRLVVHHYPDSFLPWHGQEIKQSLHELASQINPDLIFTNRRKDLHQDHRLLGELTWNTFRNHLIWEYEIPKYDGDLGRPNIFFPLTGQIADLKVNLLMSHFHTQQSKPWYKPETFQAIMRIRAIESNASEGFAEAFYADKLIVQSMF